MQNLVLIHPNVCLDILAPVAVDVATHIQLLLLVLIDLRFHLHDKQVLRDLPFRTLYKL